MRVTFIACGNLGSVNSQGDAGVEFHFVLHELNVSGHMGIAFAGTEGDLAPFIMMLIEPAAGPQADTGPALAHVIRKGRDEASPVITETGQPAALSQQGARQAVPCSHRPAHPPNVQGTHAEPGGNPSASQSTSFLQAAQSDGGAASPQK